MYLVYVDESGTTHFNDPNNYILSALIIHESTWRKFDKKVNQIKLDLLTEANPLKIELHTNHLVNNKGTEFEKYDTSTRDAILTRISNLIKKNRCRLLSVIIDKNKIDLYKKSPVKDWIQLWAWRMLLERIEKFLQKKNDETKTNYGLLCIDNNNEDITLHIKSIIQEFRKDGSMYLDSKYIIEDPFFVDSSMRNLIQIADFIAWITKRWYSIKQGSVSKYNEFHQELFNNIKIRFDKSKDKQITGAGIKIHPD